MNQEVVECSYLSARMLFSKIGNNSNMSSLIPYINEYTSTLDLHKQKIYSVPERCLYLLMELVVWIEKSRL